MKIILIGAAGTLGRAIENELSARHGIIRAGRNGADVKVDIRSIVSVQEMYAQVGKFDAVVSAAGNLHFGALADMMPEQYAIGLNDKLMGQINLVIAGQGLVNDGGSFTLTSGILGHDPIRGGASASMVNAAIDGFVKAAAIELARGVRINSVSPTMLIESAEAYGPYFRGYKPVAAAEAALAFSKSVEGAQTGKTFHVG